MLQLSHRAEIEFEYIDVFDKVGNMKWTVVCSIITIFISFLVINRNTNNVCKTFPDYYTDRDSNENCYYNPDHELEVPDIIERHGYPVQTHHVTTEDGYILTLFRIQHGKDETKFETIKTRKPVLLGHGTAVNGGSYVTIGNKSLGFNLANAGYDVWLANFRGSLYSRNHTHLEESDSKFWDFSFHELGVYDVSAKINYINKVTKQKIIYIGYSQGTTAILIYSMTYPDISYEKVEIAINLAPAAFTRNLWLPHFATYFWPFLRLLLQAVTNGKIYLKPPPLSISMFKLFCLPLPIQMEICQTAEMLVLGFNYEQHDPETLPITLQHYRDAASIKMLTHLYQLLLADDFLHFDYGTDRNTELYGTPLPPPYNFSKIKVPQYLIRAPNDGICTKENIEELYDRLPKRAKPYEIAVVQHDKFNHLDFLSGKDVVPLVYEPLLKFLNNIKLK